MPTATPFEERTAQYEAWFDDNEAAYRAELAALRRLVPSPGDGLEIGVGSARFAAPLGIGVGVDPAAAMLDIARERGVDVVRGVAESLPFGDGTFDTALLVTTICFVDDIPRTLAEAARVLGPDGRLVIGYIDKESPVGARYLEKQSDSPFYREATFVSTEGLVDALEDAGFSEFEFVQTLYDWPGEADGGEPIEPGYGEGSFVAIEATR
ncbi:MULTISPECIES: class I SAM-dependent methyltransferase [Halolamina]|uniref:Ubiquinone/menaquinone biosynthesis C-methylase UbiE n=1 Tax=Halolamina pelagica TaxID=699431 RepID=A0A1I5TMD6_9EURY|nr:MULTISPECIES: class I SAM-dependent methyltransferase [Halolamina]NHX37738.1 class I SAM-dependent methyltransferase [Halolamina sp. R1-12]SFP84254.1 Ubiquinone/menaquinone biosynthesis C-methylase UbiE [Halolamina pelagica]